MENRGSFFTFDLKKRVGGLPKNADFGELKVAYFVEMVYTEYNI